MKFSDVFAMSVRTTGCSFTVLVHTRDAATRNMEKVQVIKVGFKTILSVDEFLYLPLFLKRVA